MTRIAPDTVRALRAELAAADAELARLRAENEALRAELDYVTTQADALWRENRALHAERGADTHPARTCWECGAAPGQPCTDLAVTRADPAALPEPVPRVPHPSRTRPARLEPAA